MKVGNIAVITGVLLSAVATSSWAEGSLEAAQLDGKTNLAGREVSVAAGGLYDRYESNPPLSVIAAEAPNIDLSWFKELKKTKVDMGFESYSPNFYYKNNRVTAVFTADIDRLRALMPAKVLEEVQPLQVWPGRGLVASTAYTYEYCDNDSYNEIALSIITNKPGRSNLGPVTLIGQSMSKDFWGYVLKLPVNTELAEVRGVVGYNLPKWLTDINFRETDNPSSSKSSIRRRARSMSPSKAKSLATSLMRSTWSPTASPISATTASWPTAMRSRASRAMRPVRAKSR